MGNIRKIKAGLVKEERTNFIGEKGNIFFDISNGSLFLSDGATACGIALSTGGGGGSGPINLDINPLTVTNPNSMTDNHILQFNTVSDEFETVSLIDAITNIEGELDVIQYETLIAEATDVGVTYLYVGEAIPGSTAAGAVWRIKRVAEYDTGEIDSLWANDTADFDKTWTARATYTYNK